MAHVLIEFNKKEMDIIYANKGELSLPRYVKDLVREKELAQGRANTHNTNGLENNNGDTKN